MRKLVFQEFLSVDGYAADKDHSTKFFEDPKYSMAIDEDMLSEMQRFDLILLGANTYKMFVDFWPEADPKEQIVADKLNSIPKMVFSKSLKEAPWGRWQPAEIIRTDAAEKIEALKRQPGKDMVLWGSISLGQYFIKAGLIDEYQFRIVPVILGGGTLLFNAGEQSDLLLTRIQSYPSGILLAEYQRVR